MRRPAALKRMETRRRAALRRASSADGTARAVSARAMTGFEAVRVLENKRKVCVIGQPGIGKTRGGLAYTLQLLLARGEGVLRVSYKTQQAHLFLRRATGDGYAVWQCAASLWSQSVLVSDTELFVLIDRDSHLACQSFYAYLPRALHEGVPGSPW